jgi:4-amino-4-deoxy-L-arabinose transferase-like glycosyltransferase
MMKSGVPLRATSEAAAQDVSLQLPMTAERRIHQILLLLTVVFCLLRFAYLRADFPNHSPWMIDQAKYTDEGWWASAAVRHCLLGHWHVAGDYNPAIAVPVWPLMLTALFQFTGVSLIATRALNVLFSVATVGFIYLLVRRYADRTAAAAAALLLAVSPFAFVFSRLATLDTMIDFEWSLLLWVAATAKPQRTAAPLMLGLLMALMLLTKTTSLMLVPAVLWLLWSATRSLPQLLITIATASGIVGLYTAIVLHSRYADDYHYFYNINSLAEVQLRRTFSLILLQLRHGLWVDRILYPVAVLVFFSAVFWLRRLWNNPLFTASWIAIIGEAIYILRRQDDYAPRYFLALLAPMVFVVVLALHQLSGHKRMILAAALAAAVVLNTVQVVGFVIHRQYQLLGAAKSIQAVAGKDAHTHRVLLGSSAAQLALMTGIPSLNDEYGSQDLTQKAARFQPGWYVGWNDLDDDIVASLSAYRLDQVATYQVFDHDDRNTLTLYRMVEVRKP